MQPHKIKAKLIEREGSLSAVADKLGISRAKLSQVIHNHAALYELRKQLTKRYGIRFTKFVRSAKGARETAN